MTLGAHGDPDADAEKLEEILVRELEEVRAV